MPSFYRSLIVVLLLALLGSCNDESKKNTLKGIWTVADVKTEFDENKVNPGTLEQVAELEKQTVLHFENDTLLVLSVGDSKFNAFYTYDAASSKIFFSFDAKGVNMNELGVLRNDTIFADSETPVGKIRVFYSRSN